MRRALLAGVLLVSPVVLAAPAAAADADRTGWWNRASAGTLALPAPTTAEGDLRVASGAPDAPSAYAGLLLVAPGSRSATLDLVVRPGSLLGTPEVVACPTATAEWPDGGNQPIDQAPAYDCVLGAAFGSLSEDGTTLSFALDDTTQVADGTWSLALVPSSESTAAFALDLQPPGEQGFVPAPPEAAPDAAPQTDPGPGGPTAGDPATGDPAPPLTADTGSALPDLLLPGSSPVDVPVAAPAAAPQLAAAPADAPLPLAAAPATVLARPVAQDLPGDERSRLLALLLLVALSVAVGYAMGKDRPGPRLIGGRAGSAAAVAAGPADAPGGRRPSRERGIGRFAKPREAAPRRLR